MRALSPGFSFSLVKQKHWQLRGDVGVEGYGDGFVAGGELRCFGEAHAAHRPVNSGHGAEQPI
jgi:hypothetical protein